MRAQLLESSWALKAGDESTGSSSILIPKLSVLAASKEGSDSRSTA